MLPARAGDALSVRLDWITESMHMAFLLAEQRGWFSAAGLDVHIEDGNGSTTTVQLVGNGNFDIGLADLSPMVIAKSKGVSIISIAGIVRKGGMGFIVPKASGIAGVQDLVGRTILYTAGSLEGPFVLPFLKAKGIAADQVTLLNVQAASKLSMYFSGQGDAAITAVPPNLAASVGRRDSIGLLFWDNGFKVPGFGLVATPATLAAKGDAVKRFVGVVCGGWRYVLSGPAQMEEAARAVRQARPATPLTERMLIDQTEAYRGSFSTEATRDLPLCEQSDADWLATIATMEQAGLLAPGAKPADFYTNDYVDPRLIDRTAMGQ